MSSNAAEGAGSSAAAAAGGAAVVIPEPKSEKEIVRRFQAMVQRQRQMVAKLAELDAQRLEYKRVSDTIKPMEGGRKCYQMINNVLVERTLAEVVPIVDANLDGLEAVLRKLNEDLTSMSTEMREYQAKYNIRVVDKRKEQALAQVQAATGGAGQQGGVGVLA